MLKALILVLSTVSGAASAQVRVQEYPIPSGHGVHDVWADANPGGPIWFSAQGSGHLGILDPKSGKVELVKLGTGSSPHGVIAADDGVREDRLAGFRDPARWDRDPRRSTGPDSGMRSVRRA